MNELITTLGDRQLRADLARSLFKVDGRGVKVGIISTSFDALNGMADDVASDELPGNSDEKPVLVLKDITKESAFATDEGRALAQIVHDIAPGAELLFHTFAENDATEFADLSEAGFATAVNALKDAGADIIFDDAILLPPLSRDGVAAQAVENAIAEGVVYLSAAGNNGTISYQSNYRSGGEFSVDGIKFEAHDFNPGPGVDLYQDISVSENGAPIRPLFSWDSPARINNEELTLFLLNSPDLPTKNNILNVSAIISEETIADPLSTLLYDAAPNEQLFYTVGRKIDNSSLPPEQIKWVSAANGADRSVDYEYVDPLADRPTVYGQANAEGAITVGSSSDDGTKYDSFASRGGVPILFDEAGNRLSDPIVRRKPDVVAPDNIETAFPEDSLFNPFVGTSAAVPHVAGVVALMVDAAGGIDNLSSEAVRTILEQTSRPIKPAPGLPDSTGFVRADLAVLEARIASQDSEEDFNKLLGTSEDDLLVGTFNTDIISSLGGNDSVFGDLDNDIIYGGDGEDILRGDRSKIAASHCQKLQTFFRNSHNAQVGIGGDDVIFGGAGNDLIDGKGGNDKIFGDEGDDKIWGDDGDDLLRGGLGNDILIGDDFLLRGGFGNNIIGDRFSGGVGADVFVLAMGEGTDTVIDFGRGTDRIGLADRLSFEQLTIIENNGNSLIKTSDETLAVILNVTQLTEDAFAAV